MKHSEFLEKYRNINCLLILLNNFDISLLENIHYHLFNDCEDGEILRYKPDDLEYKEIDQVMQRYIRLLTSIKNSDEFILNALRLIAIIFLYQPFYDGNSRVCLTLLKLLLESIGLGLYLEDDEKNLNRHILSTFYTPTDEVSLTNFKMANSCVLKRLNEKN